ncbi:MAG TPA: Gmad2 immunoglobulin-like domain-containing protein [Actinomycetota bacterium]|nr:Gmad2 immunoglobulin-like domain-containing protein [Actinomycetota bacterium]
MRAIAPACVVLALALVACDSPGSAPPAGLPSARETSSDPSPEERTTPPKSVPESKRAPIEVTSPAQGDEVTSPLIVTGTANVFEATVSYQLVDGSGNEITKGFTTASCGTGCRGDYSKKIRFTVDEPTEATLEVFESSAEDGTALHVVRVSLTLLP